MLEVVLVFGQRALSMFALQLRGIIAVVTVLMMSPAYAEIWDIREKSFGAALAYEDKTADDAVYEGTKLLLDGHYFLNNKAGEFSEKRKCCALPSQP